MLSLCGLKQGHKMTWEESRAEGKGEGRKESHMWPARHLDWILVLNFDVVALMSDVAGI